MRETGMYERREPQEFQPLLDSRQAADLMHLHPESVKRLARTGAIVAAYLPAYLLDLAEGQRRGCEGRAGAAAARDGEDDA